jgi:hypothetical protein
MRQKDTASIWARAIGLQEISVSTNYLFKNLKHHLLFEVLSIKEYSNIYVFATKLAILDCSSHNLQSKVSFFLLIQAAGIK